VPGDRVVSDRVVSSTARRRPGPFDAAATLTTRCTGLNISLIADLGQCVELHFGFSGRSNDGFQILLIAPAECLR